MFLGCCFLSRDERCIGEKPCNSFVLFSRACFRAFVLMGMESFKKKCKALFRSRGCFGSCCKSTTSVSADAPSKGLRHRDHMKRKWNTSDDFWNTTVGDMDNSMAQSHGSNSSLSALNQPLDSHSSRGSTSNSSEFVNNGLLLWNQTRQQWLGNKRSHEREQLREPTISRNATYESLLGGNKPFPRRIPLPEMVDFLVDVWEQDGLYG